LDNGPSAPSIEAASVVRFRALGSLDLRGSAGQELRALLVQPKRLALFAYLALANPRRLHRRDSLLALFWPESTAEQARRSLRQALHFLRQTLGAGVLETRGDEEIGIAPGAAWCDVREFEAALDAGRDDEALALYRGHLLEGFHISDVSPELEQWLDDERARLRTRGASAASALADRAEQDGSETLAVQRLREVLRIDSGSETALRRLMTLLDRVGDRAGAMRAYDEFARRLASELDAKPSAETTALADRLRAGRNAGLASASGERPKVSSRDATVASAHLQPAASHPRRTGFGWLAAGALLVAGVAAIAFRWLPIPSSTAASNPTKALAVGALDDRTGDSASSTRVLRDLLATDLARVPGVMVVSHDRMQELLARLGSGDETRATLARAARNAGASELLEGELYRRTRDTLRLDVRRVDAATGVIRRAYTAEGRDLFAIVERMSALVAAEVGQPSPTPVLSSLTTTSIVARRLYEEGIREAYRGNRAAALRLFRSALSEDSTLAMAAYFGARAAEEVETPSAIALAAQAIRMSRYATERERLVIAAEWAFLTNSTSLVPVAESLFARFPLEPEAEFELGRALAWSGDFARAIPHFRMAARRDSLSLKEPSRHSTRNEVRCTACEAMSYLIYASIAIDSVAAAERAARELLRVRPHSIAGWGQLARALESQGRFADAMAAYRERQASAYELSSGDPPDDAFARVQPLIRAGDFSAADRLLAERARDGSRFVRVEAIWWQIISFRNQARFDEAFRAAHRYRVLVGDTDATARLPEAQVLFEAGRQRDAAAQFDTAAVLLHIAPAPGAPDSGRGLKARPHAWHFTHVAAAYAALGDTTRLARLVDSVEAFGEQSAYGRDRRLHHHLRGLLLLARGRREEAAASFRSAVFSSTVGYTRTNLELGRVLMTLGKPREAAAVLGPALRGDLDASNYYVTHAELHEQLARAFEAAGERDSARVHYAWVGDAWQSADQAFRERAARARSKSR
jgi:DNA-binding SARP family transcriptional activator